jgi:hypothetical protein
MVVQAPARILRRYLAAVYKLVQARRKYEQVIGEFLVNGREPPKAPATRKGRSITVAHLPRHISFTAARTTEGVENRRKSTTPFGISRRR